MISPLDLVLPANGVQREIYASRRRLLEYGSPAEQEQVLHHFSMKPARRENDLATEAGAHARELVIKHKSTV